MTISHMNRNARMGLMLLLCVQGTVATAKHAVLDTNAAYTEFIESHKNTPLVIKVGATWCPPCQSTKPIFEALSNDPSLSYVTFAEAVIDNEDTIGAQHGVRSLPTVLYFKDGKKVDESVGGGSFDATVREKIKKHFSPSASAVQPEQIKAQVQAVAQTVATTAQNAAQAVVTAVHDAAQSVTSSDASQRVSELVDEATAKVKEVVDEATKSVKTESPSFIDRILNFFSSIIAFFVDMLTQIGHSIKSLFA